MDFSWVADFLKWLAHLLPFHMGVCKATNRGVKFKWRGRVSVVHPGVYWWWPLFTTISLVNVKRQTLDIAPMSETTKDDKTVYVVPLVVYEVADVRAALVEVHDYDSTAAEVAKAAVVAAVTSRTKDELREAMIEDVPRELSKRVRAALKPYGLHVIEARLSEMAESRVIRTVGDHHVVPDEEDE